MLFVNCCLVCVCVRVCACQSKKRFEREWKEAEKAAQYAEKTDQDINATKADVEKVFHYSCTFCKERSDSL